MVIKGSARAGPGELAYHLLREDMNETVQVMELSGLSSLTLPRALSELDGMGAGSRSSRTLYHASINTPVTEQLTQEQQRIARVRLALELGLTGQPFAVVEHVKHGRQHTHIVWGRINVETGKAIPDSHNYRKHETVSRELEIEFGHTPVPGAHVRDKATEPRPERGPTWGELRQAERSGLTPQEAKRQITDLWQQTTTGSEFAAAIAAEGWSLARGDRRDFVLIDRAGEVHGLARRIDGVKAAQVRQRMADVDVDQLPTVDQAQQRARQQQLEQPPAFVSAVERQRIEEEQQPPARTGQQLFTHEAASAVHSLSRTMGAAELGSVVITEDRSRADKTWQQVLRETDTIDERREREAQQGREAALARAVDSAARDPRPEKAAESDRRPSAILFVQILGVLIDVYQRAIDRGLELLTAKKQATQPPKEPPAVKEILKWNRGRGRTGPDFDL